MKNSFSLSIALSGEHLITIEAKQMRFPGTDGYIGVLANRKPLIAAMSPGLIRIIDIEDQQIWLGTTGGFCEILSNEVVLLCDSIIRPEELDYDSIDHKQPFFRVDHKKMTEKQKIAYVSRMLAAQLRSLNKHKNKG